MARELAISCQGFRKAVACLQERDFSIDNLLVRIHLFLEMILVDRSCAMGA